MLRYGTNLVAVQRARSFALQPRTHITPGQKPTILVTFPFRNTDRPFAPLPSRTRRSGVFGVSEHNKREIGEGTRLTAKR